MHMQRAVSLIELLISVSLGLMIVLTAFAGFRAASASVTTANRLSLENALMRNGYLVANEEVDFWTQYDSPDPTIPDNPGPGLRQPRPLRQVANGIGNAFTPFSVGSATYQYADSTTPDADRGWDPTYEWPAHDPRAWYRGDAAEKCNGIMLHGRYALVSCTAPTMAANTASSFDQVDPASTADPVLDRTYALYGDVTVPHTWLDNQVRGLFDTLGWYGTCEYMPNNAIFECTTPYQEGDPWTNGCTSPSGRMWAYSYPYSVGDPWRFVNSDGGQQTPKGLWRLSFETAYALHDPHAADLPTAATQSQRSRRRYHVGFTWGSAAEKTVEIDSFKTITGVEVDPLPLKPASWPDVDVTVHRFIRCRRFAAISLIRWTSPITGELAELSFANFGSTLRGARQQRHRDGNTWAEWDNKAGFVSDPTLDSPSAASGWTPAPHLAVVTPVLAR